jgi:hypothetical protein
MWQRAIVVIVLLLLPTGVWGQPGKRVALLIGNQAYSSELGRLTNPHNDIALLDKALKGLGFEVTTVRDADLGALHEAVNAHARRLQAPERTQSASSITRVTARQMVAPII